MPQQSQQPTRHERQQFSEAHADGLHDRAPREFCPECEALSPAERAERWELDERESRDADAQRSLGQLPE